MRVALIAAAQHALRVGVRRFADCWFVGLFSLRRALPLGPLERDTSDGSEGKECLVRIRCEFFWSGSA